MNIGNSIGRLILNEMITSPLGPKRSVDLKPIKNTSQTTLHYKFILKSLSSAAEISRQLSSMLKTGEVKDFKV